MSTASSCFANLMMRTRAYNLKPTDADAISEKATEVPTIRLKVDWGAIGWSEKKDRLVLNSGNVCV